MFICEDKLAERSIISLCFSTELIFMTFQNTKFKKKKQKQKKNQMLFDEGTRVMLTSGLAYKNMWSSFFVTTSPTSFSPSNKRDAKCDTNVQYVPNTHLQLIKATPNLILQHLLSSTSPHYTRIYTPFCSLSRPEILSGDSRSRVVTLNTVSTWWTKACAFLMPPTFPCTRWDYFCFSRGFQFYAEVSIEQFVVLNKH